MLRVTIMNPSTTAEHMARLLDGLAALGRDLAAAGSEIGASANA